MKKIFALMILMGFICTIGYCFTEATLQDQQGNPLGTASNPIHVSGGGWSLGTNNVGISTTNNVGIGTTDTSQGALTVNGQIIGAYPATLNISTIATNGLRINQQNTVGSSIMTVGTSQYAGYWNDDATSHLVLCKRSLATDDNGIWTCYTYDGTGGRPTISLPANDNHDGIMLGHDENGFIHIAYVDHGQALHYYRSNSANDVSNATSQVMTGANNTQVTYHYFFNDSNGKLYDIFRSGIAGNGSAYLFSYNSSNTTWSAATGTGTGGLFLDGSVGTTSNPYWTNPFIDSNNNMYIWWLWNYSSVFHGVQYLKFNLITGTATKSDGTSQTIPATQSNDEVVDSVADGSLGAPINRRPICVTSDGIVLLFYEKQDTNGNNQIWMVKNSGSGWSTPLQLTQDMLPYQNNGSTGSLFTSVRIPNVLIDSKNVIYVLFYDVANGDDLKVLQSNDKGVTFKRYSLLPHIGGMSYDNNMDYQGWDKNNTLYLEYQYAPGGTIKASTNRPVYLLHWTPNQGGRSDSTTMEGISNYNDIYLTSYTGYIHLFGDVAMDTNSEQWISSGDSISTAITLASSGGVIHLGPGTYTITSGLTVNKSLTIIGAGKGRTTISSVTDGTKIFNITSDNVLIKDLSESVVVGGTGTGTNYCNQVDATATTIFSNVNFENVGCTLTDTSSNTPGSMVGIRYLDAGGTVRNFTMNCSNNKFGCLDVYGTAASTQEAATTINIYNADVTAACGGSTGAGFAVEDSSATQNMTMNIYNSKSVVTENAACNSRGAVASGGTHAILNIYNSSLNGNDFDILEANSAPATVYDTILVNNLISGTITYSGTLSNNNGSFNGNVGIGTTVPTGKMEIEGGNIGIGTYLGGALITIGGTAPTHTGNAACIGNSANGVPCLGYSTGGTYPSATCTCF